MTINRDGISRRWQSIEPGMKKLLLALTLVAGVVAPTIGACAQSWLDESLRDFEELRLRQLLTVQQGREPAPFTTDGCSGKLSDGWKLVAENLPAFAGPFGEKPPWESCCLIHDKVYWQGAAVDGYEARKRADRELQQCVVATGEEQAPQLSLRYGIPEAQVRQAFAVAAEIMYRAVRIGGQPCSLLPWRWGYGWENCAFASPSDIQEKGFMVSNVKPDEHVTFFNTAAWFDAGNDHWHIPVHVWVYEPQQSVVRKGISAALLSAKYNLKVNPENEANFRERINLMFADNKDGRRIRIRLAGQDFKLPKTQANGHAITTLKLPKEVVEAFANEGHLQFFALLPSEDQRRLQGDVQLVPPEGISVISDIDDTVKVTEVESTAQLFDNTFFKDFRTVAGMPEFYRKMADRGAVIHFVSSSPWQLYDPLQAFVQIAGFPGATMSLKNVRFLDETFFNLFKKGLKTKPEQIEPILRRYPHRQFILIGDNGEHDPEVYGEFARRFPRQVRQILIRNMDDSNPESERFQKAFRDIPQVKWQLFAHPRDLVLDELIREE